MLQKLNEYLEYRFCHGTLIDIPIPGSIFTFDHTLSCPSKDAKFYRTITGIRDAGIHLQAGNEVFRIHMGINETGISKKSTRESLLLLQQAVRKTKKKSNSFIVAVSTVADSLSKIGFKTVLINTSRLNDNLQSRIDATLEAQKQVIMRSLPAGSRTENVLKKISRDHYYLAWIRTDDFLEKDFTLHLPVSETR